MYVAFTIPFYFRYAPTKAYVIALQHLGGWTARNMMLAISMANLTTLATASARMVV